MHLEWFHLTGPTYYFWSRYKKRLREIKAYRKFGDQKFITFLSTFDLVTKMLRESFSSRNVSDS